MCVLAMNNYAESLHMFGCFFLFLKIPCLFSLILKLFKKVVLKKKGGVGLDELNWSALNFSSPLSGLT